MQHFTLLFGKDQTMTPSALLQKLNLAGLYPPRILTLAITKACNLACCHCWVDAGSDTSPAHVSLQDIRPCVVEFAALGGDGIRITGGEPQCHPHCLEIVQFACFLGF